MRLTEADHARVSEAVTAAERSTDGEIVTVVAGRSDAYHDVGLHWTMLTMLLVLALFAFVPAPGAWLHGMLVGGWDEIVPPGWYLSLALILMAATFLVARIVFAIDGLRMTLTPGATKARRVHARAMALFRTAAEKRTLGSTGVLIYLSITEHRAEIIADEAIHSKVTADVWGEAMAALIAGVKRDEPGAGMADAVAQVGIVLAEHFPRSEGDTNELPDRLIEL
jgi:putative membrane protein